MLHIDATTNTTSFVHHSGVRIKPRNYSQPDTTQLNTLMLISDD
ncbi:hypothetical protein [Xylella fastidiosa]|nr:hypothetical protein [Xylella fastidiosa]